MAPIYTLRFAARSFTEANWFTVFVPDAGYTWIARHLVISNDSGTAATAVVVHVLTRDAQTVVLYSAPALEANTSVAVDLRQELLVDEQVQAFCGASFWSLALTGYRFLGESPPRASGLPAPM